MIISKNHINQEKSSWEKLAALYTKLWPIINKLWSITETRQDLRPFYSDCTYAIAEFGQRERNKFKMKQLEKIWVSGYSIHQKFGKLEVI